MERVYPLWRVHSREVQLWPVLIALVWLPLGGCGARVDPAIEFTRVPAAGIGDPDKLEAIEGRALHAIAGQRVVLYAQSGTWWVQPLANQPFTPIQPDSSWKNWTHPGFAYAALLVDAGYHAAPTLTALPAKGGAVLAVAVIQGRKAAAPQTLEFSGYRWEIRDSASDRSGTRNYHDPANAWTDPAGILHLRVSHRGDRWSSAEVRLTRSLGYGSYRFTLRDISHLEPAAVFSAFTRADDGPIREMDIEVSRWGEPDDKNSQYVVQPYFVAANTFRFLSPAGPLTFAMLWSSGQATFQTLRAGSSDAAAKHVFSSGVPVPGNERIHMNVYVYDNKRRPLQRGFEILVEKFEFLP